MPDIDGGHYFLTAFMPVRTEPLKRADGTITAPAHALREALADLPTAMQSQACLDAGLVSPFARCARTHFARMFVLDQPAYNGRDPGDSVVQGLRDVDLLVPQQQDCLACPWLVVVIDFDTRQGEADGGLASYAAGLWRLMRPELVSIFEHCHGFAPGGSGEDFAAYLRACKIETTMSFNDYWPGPPPLPSLSLGALVGIGAAMLAGLVLAEVLLLHALHATLRWLWLGVPLALLIAVGLLYLFVMKRGARAFPAAPGADLPSVLKALYVQQRFATFAAARQQDAPAALHAAFGAFLAEVDVANDIAPTRRPGRIGG